MELARPDTRSDIIADVPGSSCKRGRVWVGPRYPATMNTAISDKTPTSVGIAVNETTREKTWNPERVPAAVILFLLY
ncbi:hypothetical protein EYF80_032106 [Liparis tanakae]|uniref:Uncharacterized protein n=1 Tax=Liparis tanakae TaxID=230148 RepID=A0A4Z2GYF8_9TELE|nr:hypothetical protein EYF80_032106 [Liparis tanakae]